MVGQVGMRKKVYRLDIREVFLPSTTIVLEIQNNRRATSCTPDKTKKGYHDLMRACLKYRNVTVCLLFKDQFAATITYKVQVMMCFSCFQAAHIFIIYAS